MSQFQDVTLVSVERQCGAEFTWTARDQQFYKDHDYTIPRSVVPNAARKGNRIAPVGSGTATPAVAGAGAGTASLTPMLPEWVVFTRSMVAEPPQIGGFETGRGLPRTK